MDITDRSPGRGPAPEAEDLLIRAAMEQAAEGVPPLPDLVPVALVQGRRRRTRARAAVGAGVASAVALGVFGVALPMWGPGGGSQEARTGSAASRTTTATPSPTTARPALKPVHVEPTDGETPMADLPAAERARQEEFQQQVAVLLGELFHEQLGAVRPVDLAVNRYQGGSDGNTFPLIFSVRPKGDPGDIGADPACVDNPLKGFRCRTAMLPGGIKVRAVTAEGNGNGSQTITGVDLKFTYGTSTVRLSVAGDDSSMVSAPVTVEQLAAAAGDPRFMALVKYADAHPMEDKEHSVRGG
ncbi:hypothetical protein ABT025_10085 [Streptomyces sp. NPDC002809]|uniref:hypothetical protein n=1 Tax=Streptomyces sp. NPDC002809 TaxID=3154433 RepID=UPI00331B50D6